MTLVIGVGSPDRGDDGVGSAVVTRLSGRHAEGLRTCFAVEPVDVIDAWAGEEDVVLVDAVEDPSSPAGTVLVLTPDDPAVERVTPAGTHAVGLSTVLALASTLDRRPARLVLVGVVGESFAVGAPLSAPVAAAVPFACAAVRGLARRTPARPSAPTSGEA